MLGANRRGGGGAYADRTMLKNAKAKGSRRERQARDILAANGFAVTKAGGSLGLWDLVGVRRDPTPDCYLPVAVLVQVKSNVWPRPIEQAALEADAARYSAIFVGCEVWRFDDRKTTPRVKRLNGDWL